MSEFLKAASKSQITHEEEKVDTTSLSNFELKQDIVIFNNVLKKEQCDVLIKYTSNDLDRWKKATTFGEQPEHAESSPRQADVWSINQSDDIDERVFKVFSECLTKVREFYPDLHIESDEGYGLLKYSPGGYYSTHTDHGPSNIRTISALIYLNDDYEGGELYFPRQDIKIKPKTGQVVFFPSNYLYPHASLPITSGTKYSIVTWFK